jgi:acetate kinase
MKQVILTINSGSSSIKFALFELAHPLSGNAVVSGQIDGIGAAETRLIAKDNEGNKLIDEQIPGNEATHERSLDHTLSWLTAQENSWRIVAIGHRVVHGGDRYAKPMVLDQTVIEQLRKYISLAPLHQPHNLNGIEAIQELLPGVSQVACFDTAFHRSNPPVAQTFGLPRWLTAEGVKRYGFHGLSYEYIARALPEHSPRASGRVIVAHLGNGASMAAMVDRKGVASTMGFTAVDGLMMGTRTGNLDPGVMLYLIENKHMNAAELTSLLYKESGLLGVSGISQDMRTLLASDKPEAEEAVDLFCYRIVRELGSLTAAAGGLDALVFTGGIGEHAPEVRRRVALQAGWLGIKLSPEANAHNKIRISAPDSPVDVLVIPTNEEWMIAHHTQTLLNL